MQTVMVALILKGRCCPRVYAKDIAVCEIETMKLERQKMFHKQKSDLN